MLNRQVAAEAKLMAEMYCGLNREAQIAMMANMEGMARAYPDLASMPEVTQPLPKNPTARRISDPPGMPIRTPATPARTRKHPWNLAIKNSFGDHVKELAAQDVSMYRTNLYPKSGDKAVVLEMQKYSYGK